jgi:hypothetical protein
MCRCGPDSKDGTGKRHRQPPLVIAPENKIMRNIGKLFGAFPTLADSLLSLAAVIDNATAKVRQQLDRESDSPALPHGEVIDAAPEANGTPKSKRSKATVLPCRRRSRLRMTGWPRVVTGPGLPQTRTCSH